MDKPARVIPLLAACATIAVFIVSCGQPPPVNFVQAPPGPSDLGPATGCSTPPAGAVVFELKYWPQAGTADDVQYHSYWGYGGSSDEAKKDSFLRDVRRKTSRVQEVYSPVFKDRNWAAVEYSRRQATALYFDLNANGKLEDNERILPTRGVGQGRIEFITPDFVNTPDGGGPALTRALLQVNFFGGSEPNCMWSPAALLDGAATLNDKSVRLLLYANNPGGAFDQYGSSSYSLLTDGETRITADRYVPRERLSSLISSDGQFYHLTIEGRRSNGLPARALLVKDTSPTGTLAVKLAGSNSLQSKLTYLYLNGADDKTVIFRVSISKETVTLPVGNYVLNSGMAAYGLSNAYDWEVSLSEGPTAAIKEGETVEVALGQPTLTVRAIDEKDRYSSQATAASTFKQGTPIYLEPKIVGKNQEIFGRFRHPAAAGGQNTDCPPTIKITGPGGKQVFSKTMEYG